MISVVIPTLDAEPTLNRTLATLVPATVDGLIREVVVADGGSRDRTIALADDAGAVIVKASGGRGPQLIAGAEAARGRWLLFLHADTVLDHGWQIEAARLMDSVDTGWRAPCAGVFRLALDDAGVAPRVVERAAGFRARLLGLPFGDQGLLVPRRLYAEVGGYRPLAIMEDVDFVRRLGRRRIHHFAARATTSAARYRREGYLRRVVRNQACLALYALGGDPQRIARRYAGPGTP